jgi:thioredoxin reductase
VLVIVLQFGSAMFDVAVVGGGPAGLSAALMLGRCRRRVLLCDLGQPRNRRSHALHGYLTRDGIAPPELNELGRRELTTYGIELRCTGVTAARREGDHFRVALGTGGEEAARYLLIATGVVDDLPAIGGFDECYGQSIFHCPYCDGWEWRDRRLVAFGRGANVVGLALGLKTWSGDVLVCTHGARLDAVQRDRLARNGLALRTERIAELLHHDGRLSRIAFSAGDAVERDALFFSTGQHPQSPLAIGLGCALTSQGAVRTGNRCDTNVDRVFVVGDASRDAQFVVVAAAEGVKAAVAINRALQAEELAR